MFPPVLSVVLFEEINVLDRNEIESVDKGEGQVQEGGGEENGRRVRKRKMLLDYLGLPMEMVRQIVAHVFWSQCVEALLRWVLRVLQQRNCEVDLRRGEYPFLHLFLTVGALRIVIEIGAATESVNHTDVIGLLSVCMSVAFDGANEEVNRVRLAVKGVATYES